MTMTQDQIDAIFEQLELKSEDDRQRKAFTALSSLEDRDVESVVKTYATYNRSEQ